MDAIIIFFPFVMAFGLYCMHDPLTRRFWDGWEE